MVHRAACISGIPMRPPFRVQFRDAVQWNDFPFIDQLEIGSRLCSMVAFSKTSDVQQFPVLGVDAMFEIRSANSMVTMQASGIMPFHSQQATPSREVRIAGVGDFFIGTHLTFVDGMVVM